MVRFQRASRVSGGKFPEALKWAHEIAEYLNGRTPRPTKIQVFIERFSAVGTICWVGDYESVAALESFQNELLSDEEYWTIVRRGADLFIEGSTKDTLMTSV